MKIGRYELCRYVMPLMNANMYMIISGKRALIIDPMNDPDAFNKLETSDVDDTTVILTHEHFDHISGVNSVRDQLQKKCGSCTVYANEFCADAVKSPDTNLSRFFEDMFITRAEDERKLAEEIFDKDYFCETDVSFKEDTEVLWEDLVLNLRNTPGHSPGSICIEITEKKGSLLALATGDSLVEGNSVITRLPNGSKSDYRNITRPYLESFSPDTLVLPGHGEISLMKDLVLG